MSGFKIRTAQREFERGVEQHRVCGLLARRQYGKTTIAGRIALKKMMKIRGHTVIFGSVKLDLGREIVRKESAALQQTISNMAGDAKGMLKLAEGDKLITGALDADAFADLYEQSRLELRLYHDRTTYSRTKVVALTRDAVGETGDLILDEVGRVKGFRDVLEAVMPIIASNPDFRCIYTTTPPPDDTHPSFELLAPPIGAELSSNPRGNWYRSELGVHVLRVTAEDAYADGIPLYDDDTGAPISPAESRARAHDKDAWDRNYGCQFVIGGTAAVGLLQLDTAQRRGVDECLFIRIDSDDDLDRAVEFLIAHLGEGKVGLGWDLATTTKATSNPSSFTVRERVGNTNLNRLVAIWKTADPKRAREIVGRLITAVSARPAGGPARRLCIDATNERYFAQGCRDEFGSRVPVELVIGSETIEVPGEPEPLTMKQYLGSRLVAHFDDNHEVLPPDRYVREDVRLVRKEKGLFVCEPDADGKHGDTFDSGKLAEYALISTGGAVLDASQIVVGQSQVRRPTFRPRRWA